MCKYNKPKLTVWLVNPYGPITGESWRDYSFTSIANALTKNGHQVVWWTSNFSHHFKHYRSDGWKDLQVSPRFTIRLVPTSSYKNNISLGRVFRDIIFAYRTYRRGIKLPPPDCIFYSESPLNFGYAGFMLARYHKCPVIFHQMDLWPELLEKAFPLYLRFLAKVIFSPVYYIRRVIYKRLSAVTALASYYLEIPLQEAPVLASKPNAVVYNGIDVKKFRESLIKSRKSCRLIPSRKKGEVRAVFAGSLGPSYDILTLINVAKLIDESGSKIKIIIAGDGPLRGAIENFIACHPNTSLTYVGKLKVEDLVSLYAICDIGLCSYSNKSNVEMPDKIYDYTAAGLAILNSLTGEVRDFLDNYQLGFQYEAGNADDLYHKLSLFELDHSLLKQKTSNSYELGMKFDVHLQHQKLIDLIEQVTGIE
jgi:glycosyltransferase involved in cell wall biosynthesis